MNSTTIHDENVLNCEICHECPSKYDRSHNLLKLDIDVQNVVFIIVVWFVFKNIRYCHVCFVFDILGKLRFYSLFYEKRRRKKRR